MQKKTSEEHNVLYNIMGEAERKLLQSECLYNVRLMQKQTYEKHNVCITLGWRRKKIIMFMHQFWSDPKMSIIGEV